MANASKTGSQRVADATPPREMPRFVFDRLTPAQSEVALFAILTALGVASSYYAVDIPGSNLSIDGRWVFLFLSIGLLRRAGLILIQSCILVLVNSPAPAPLLALVGTNIACTALCLVTARGVHRRLLRQVEGPLVFGLGWFLTVIGCYHVFLTPILSAGVGLGQGETAWAAMLDGWRNQPLMIESVVVAIVSTLGMLAATSNMALRRSREMLRTMIDASPVSIITIDNAGLVDTWNHAAEHLFGWTARETIGHPLRMIPSNRLDESRAVRERAAAGEQVTQFEAVRQRKDGRLIDVSISTSRLTDANGRLSGLMAAIEDISERKRTERALREGKAQLDMALGAAKMGVWTWDIVSDDVALVADHHALYGLDEGAVLGTIQDVLGMMHPDDQDRAWQAFRCTIDTGAAFDLSYRVIWPDGSVHWLHSHGRLIPGSDQAHDRIVGTTHDISAIRQAQIENEKQLVSLQQAERIASLGYFERNWQSGQGYWSDGFCRLLGIPTGSAYDHAQFMGFIHPDDRERASAHIRDTLANHREMNIDFRIVRADGTVLDIHGVASNTYDDQGRPLLTRGTFQDVTKARRLAEESARLQAQFERAERIESVGRLAGGVAHDLNNLLTPILGYGDMLVEDLDDDSAPLAREIVDAATRAKDLIQQLLAFSRNQVLTVAPIDMNHILAQFTNLLRRTIREDIKIEIVAAPGLPLVQGDVGQLEQVIMNLAVNAHDAMPQGGTLTLRTGTETWEAKTAARFEGVSPGEYVVLEVSDTGSGMDAGTLERIFEPFFTTKPVGKGTGLGLATVFGIVKQHGGAVRVESEVGAGSTFIIYLPAAKESAPPMPQTEPTPCQMGGSETILLVEDDESVRNLAERILTRLGYCTLVAQDAFDALDIAWAHDGALDLLLTDVVMPEMNGRELYERMAADYPGIRVIYMSGYDDDVIAQRGVLGHGVTFIQKPFAAQALAARLREVLAS